MLKWMWYIINKWAVFVYLCKFSWSMKVVQNLKDTFFLKNLAKDDQDVVFPTDKFCSRE